MPRISRRTNLLHFQNQSEKAFSHFRRKIFGLLFSLTCKSYVPHHSYLLPSIGILSSRSYQNQEKMGIFSSRFPEGFKHLGQGRLLSHTKKDLLLTKTVCTYFKKGLAGLQNGQFQSRRGPLALEAGSLGIK